MGGVVSGGNQDACRRLEGISRGHLRTREDNNMHRANLPNRDTATTRRRCGQRRHTALYTRANYFTNPDTNPDTNQGTNPDTEQFPSTSLHGRQMLPVYDWWQLRI